MSKRISTKLVLIAILILAISMTSAVVVADTTKANTPVGSINIMHISDIHYIPEYYCYQGDLEENDFATKIKGDPKLMLESYAILESTVDMIISKGKELDYVFLTGDITSNGERQSLIDVANAMRAMQNEIRKVNPDFQVLAVPGNHDVFNNKHASFYNTEDGKKVPAPIASRKDFAKIYAGLGYPNMTKAEADAFYSQEELTKGKKHLPYKVEGDTTFVESNNASQLTFEYYGDESNMDELGGLTYMAYDEGRSLSICGFDTNLSIENGQETEGEFQAKNIDWYESKDLSKYTQIIMGHHNVFNHHPMQEQFTPAFVSYGTEEVAERLTRKGARYSFTGHFHANDVNSYVSFNNNVLYDIETGATISYGSAMREVVIKTYEDGTQDLESTLIKMDKADFSYLFEIGKVPAGYEDCFEGNIVDIQKYIDKKLFTPYLANMIDSFIGPIKINAAIDKLKPLDMSFAGVEIYVDLKEVVYQIINEFNTKVLKDYKYRGDIESLQKPENKYLGYLHELLSDGVNIEVARGKTLNDLVLYSYGQHLMGAEPKDLESSPQWYKDGIEGFRNGTNVEKVFDKVLFDKGAIYDRLKALLSTPLDLSNCNESKSSIATLIKLIDKNATIDNIVINDLVPKALDISFIKDMLNKKGINLNMGSMNLVDYVDSVIDKYYTDALRMGVGSVLSEVAVSFATDNSYDGKFGEKVVYKVNDSDAHSFMGVGKAKIEPTIDNGRLPSNIAVTFGADPKTAMNFVWFTSQYAPNGSIRYRVKGTEDWTDGIVNSAKMPYSYPAFDLGLFSTKVHKNITRHNARLTDLEAGKTYEYEIISDAAPTKPTKGTFKTAPDANSAFDVSIIADLQGMEELNYKRAMDKLAKSESLFNNGVDFVINLGDFVDDGKNFKQWKGALDVLSPYLLKTTQVAVIGNHESGKYSSIMSEKDLAKREGRYTNVELEEMEYSPFNFHFDVGGEDMFTAVNYYSFDYSAVHFVVLDTNDTESNGKMSDAQVEWLDNDLKNTDKKYKIVLMHKGIYSSGAHSFDKEVEAMRGQLAPIFYSNKVNIVFQGHDHTYAETPLLDGNGKEVSDGVLYVTMGTMGDKRYKSVENKAVPKAFGEQVQDPTLCSQTMGKLSFDGNALTYQGYIFDEDGFVKVEDYVKKVPFSPWYVVIIVAAVVVIAAIVFVVFKNNGKKVKAVKYGVTDSISCDVEEPKEEEAPVEEVSNVEEQKAEEAPAEEVSGVDEPKAEEAPAEEVGDAEVDKDKE